MVTRAAPGPAAAAAAAQAAPAKMPAATPMAFARVMVAACARAGVDAAPLLAQAQITPQQLAQPDARMTARQMELLSAAAMQALDDEALGAFSRRLPWGSYGMLARASLSAPDLGLALRRWCRHHGLLTDDLALSLQVAGDEAVIRIDARADLARHGEAAHEFCLVHLLRNIHGLACWFVDSRIPLRQARFPFARPAHAAVYPILFAPDCRFGAAQAEIRFDARYLGLPVRRDERAMRQMLQRALPLTVLQYRHDRLLVQQVRQLLATQAQATRSAEGLAHQLNLSVRTLHRQLRGEGARLQQLKDEVRHERARELLLRTRKPVKQIAAEVGFRNEKSFIRAFRAWAGMGPGELRAAQ